MEGPGDDWFLSGHDGFGPYFFTHPRLETGRVSRGPRVDYRVYRLATTNPPHA